MSNTTTFTELLGHMAYAFNEAQPFLPMYTHLILSALFPIFTGAYSSLSRPKSAASRPKKSKSKKDDEFEDDEEHDVQKMEGLSPSDAIVFPVMAGCTLAGLYAIIKYVGPDLLNKVMRWYFGSLSVFSVAKMVNDGLGVVGSFVWPRFYGDGGALWEVKERETSAVKMSSGSQSGGKDGSEDRRRSPLPGLFGRIPLSESTLGMAWKLRNVLSQRYLLRVHVQPFDPLKAKITLRVVVSALAASAMVAYAQFIQTPWWMTNIQGFAFSYSALQLLSPTSFTTGSMILAALFFYDIYFVFYTPMMVTVASNLDIPIKLLFPRPPDRDQEADARRLAMLGLGDVVLPGLMIGLALRFDLFMHYVRLQQEHSEMVWSDPEPSCGGRQQYAKTVLVKAKYKSVSGQWGNSFWTHPIRPTTSSYVSENQARTETQRIENVVPNFRKPYFVASIIGYVLGMCVTLGVMQAFQHAQPALLYLVPGVLGSIWLTALARGEIRAVWDFSEVSDDDEEDGEKGEDGKGMDGEKGKTKKDGETEANEQKEQSWSEWFGQSFFSAEKSERNAKRLEKALAKNVTKDEGDQEPGRVDHSPRNSTDIDKKKSAKSVTDSTSSSNDNSRSKEDVIISFSLTHLPSSTSSTAPIPSSRPNEPQSRKEGSTSKGASSKDLSPDSAVLVESQSDPVQTSSSIPRWKGSLRSRGTGGTVEREEKRLRTS